jgi:formate dehydrogenase subunit gamma
MVGVVMIFVLWVRHNIPSRVDLKWLALGGGMFKKGVHPPAKKFNAGQKLIFWAVILGGISISLSGLALLFPFELPLFAKTFQVLNIFGLGLPENLTMMQEMQLSQLWHGIVSLVLIAIIIAHIYIGTLGMEGAFEAMGSGQVDVNWAKEHHSLWVEDVRHKGSGAQQPAE